MTGPATNKDNQRDPNIVMGFTNLPDLRTRAPLSIARGKGVFIFDESGKDYLEAVSSFYCTSFGFSEEALIEAAVKQMREMPFYVTAAHRSVPVVERLAEKLIDLAPIPDGKVAFSATGSEANDALIKFLWFHNNAVGEPKRKKLISRLGSYHGGTVASASLTGLPRYNGGFDLPLPGFLYCRQPDLYNHRQPGEGEEDYAARLVAEIESLILDNEPESIGAFIGEPVSLSAGLSAPPAGYWPTLARMLNGYGIKLFADEIITGFWRTGNFWGCETYGIAPDCMTVAKALSSAYQPISATIMSDDFYQGLEKGSGEIGMFNHAGTYHGHPVAAAVALRTLELLEERQVGAHVQRIMPLFHRHLDALREHPLVGDVRKVGLAGGLEFVLDKETRRRASPAGSMTAELAALAQENGLVIRPSGERIVLAPPLIITEAEIDELFRRFNAAMEGLLDWARATQS